MEYCSNNGVDSMLYDLYNLIFQMVILIPFLTQPPHHGSLTFPPHFFSYSPTGSTWLRHGVQFFQYQAYVLRIETYYEFNPSPDASIFFFRKTLPIPPLLAFWFPHALTTFTTFPVPCRILFILSTYPHV